MYPPSTKITPNVKCRLCSMYQVGGGGGGGGGGSHVVCRVCGAKFHHVCLEKQGWLNDSSAKAAIAHANTPVGWSCQECVSQGHVNDDVDDDDEDDVQMMMMMLIMMMMCR